MKGFTLVELLVTVSVVGILSVISIANFEEFKNKTVLAKGQLLINNALTAVEAGKIERPLSAGGVTLVEQLIGSHVSYSDGGSGLSREQMFPGLVVPEDFGLYIYSRTGCTQTPVCNFVQIFASNCQGYYYGGIYFNENPSYTATRFHNFDEEDTEEECTE